VARDLRRAGFRIDLAFRGNVARRMRRANRIGARAAILFGDDELARATMTVRDLDSGAQTEVPRDRLAEALERYRS
jgi:histidyl-tRNA synthetase